MQLENSFTVPVPIDEAWRVLLDIERIAPCMPGAALDSVEGDDFTGRVKVKLGMINLTYQGKASFVEKDEAAHRAVIDARGKDQRGNGTAAAVITATLGEQGGSTKVDVVTDLNITGRPAQFGRGVMTDVGNKLLGQFADKLAAQLGAGEQPAAAPAADTAPIPAAAAPAAETAPIDAVVRAAPAERAAGTGAAEVTEAVRSVPTVPRPLAGPAAQTEPEPIDLLEVAGGAAVARYAAPAAVVGALLVLVVWLLRRRRE